MTDSFESFTVSDQQLRSIALNAMILAAESQAAALHSMDREHSLGVENSYSIKRLLGRTKDFVQSTQEIVKLSESNCSFTETRDKIRSLAAGARTLKDEADKFKSASEPKAKARYETLLMQLGQLGEQTKSQLETPAGKAATPTDVAIDSPKITVQAGFACMRAEIDEFAAFSMQIHAVCNLALEYALNAAAKSARSHSNI